MHIATHVIHSNSQHVISILKVHYHGKRILDCNLKSISQEREINGFINCHVVENQCLIPRSLHTCCMYDIQIYQLYILKFYPCTTIRWEMCSHFQPWLIFGMLIPLLRQISLHPIPAVNWRSMHDITIVIPTELNPSPGVFPSNRYHISLIYPERTSIRPAKVDHTKNKVLDFSGKR